ncbi:unnamed protein product [Arabidopsis thaliana]|uniref:(thale cress) hypothetical protein n=1 Tax=Arabidopsis thaliana TaxID=3702 RepID=A0A7G2EWQ9_ARATH|nr:unnamed protein product [Arabidopsis thaliana]
MLMISHKLNLILIIIVIGGSIFRRVSSYVADFTEPCNGICGGLTLPYPFGFSPGCQIRFNCSAADQRVKIGEFSVQNVTEDSIVVRLPRSCTRKIEDMTPLFGMHFAPTSENSFLMEDCAYKTSGCSINQRFLKNGLKLESCDPTRNISCFSSNTSNSKNSANFFSMKGLRNSTCSLLLSSMAFDSVGVNAGIAIEVERVRLGWWLTEGCRNTTCAENAACTDVRTPDESTGHRCSCLEGYHGDGYINPCLRRLRGLAEGNDKVKISIATVCSVIGLAILVICLYFFLTSNRRKGKQRNEGKDVEDHMLKDAKLLQLDFDTIRLATNDFSRDNQLGEGGFGAVYKGVLESGEEIAVKRLSMKSGQGDNEFVNEVSLVAKLQHRNLVRLLGFCFKGEERLLIYEFFKNTSLEKFIFDSNRRMILDWETRYRVISGVAREQNSLFLLSYVWKSWREGQVLNIVDPSLIETRGLSDEIMKCIHLGLLCVQENPKSRPTMASVVRMLNANSLTLPRPLQPAFYSGVVDSSSRDNNHTRNPRIASLNDVTITELDPR